MYLQLVHALASIRSIWDAVFHENTFSFYNFRFIKNEIFIFCIKSLKTAFDITLLGFKLFAALLIIDRKLLFHLFQCAPYRLINLCNDSQERS